MIQFFSFVKMSASATCRTILMAASVMVPTSAIAQYKLQPGDALEISVIGVPELKQRSQIGVDGEIALPLVGQIKVSGLSVSEAGAKITQYLSNKLYQQETNDGREIQHLILPETITVTVAEYRPLYVSGDVAKPGEYPFRPGMTVRQALSLAGGYDVPELRGVNSLQQAADLRSEEEALWVEFATVQARIWRLRTELGEQGVEYLGSKAPIPAELAERLKQVETEHLKARMADRQKDEALLQEAIAKANMHLAVLVEKKKNDEEESKADNAELEKIRDLAQRGLASAAGLSEARRAMLLSADQLLQTVVEMSNIERQRDEFARQMEKAESQKRIDAWRELQDENLRLAQITTRLKSTDVKLIYAGLPKSQLPRALGARLEIIVYRNGGNGAERLAADEETDLMPGDSVDVSLQAKGLAEARTRPQDVQ